MHARTLPALLAERVHQTPEATAFRVVSGAHQGPSVTWAEFAVATNAVAHALSRHGLTPGDRIGILAPNCVEWEYVQMGALRLGAVVVGIDPNYADDTLRAAVGSAGLSALAVQNRATLERIPGKLIDSLKCVVTFEAVTSPMARTMQIGDALTTSAIPSALAPPSGADHAIVVFSSGTTGAPKAIAYTHEQVVAAVNAIVEAFPGIEQGAGSLLCWLPLANLFQRIINFCAIAKGATSYVVGNPREVMQALPVACPDLLIGVPRFYERVYQGVVDSVASLSGVRGMLGRWALDLMRRRADSASSPSDRVLGRLADALVLRRLRGAFGPRLRYLICGSAPMPEGLLRWYEAIGLPIYEAYGVGENIIPVAMNRPGERRLGSVGKPLSLNEVRIDNDGEILVRGPGLFSGYLSGTSGPDTARQRADYWPTGDLGSFDSDGFLSVTGRKADIFKSPGGRWLSPTRIEAQLRTVSVIDQAVVFGAGRPALIAVVSLNLAALRASPRCGIDTQSASAPGSITDAQMSFVRDAVREAVALLPKHERPQAVLLITRPFTVSGGELTSNLKLRRRAIEEKFRTAIENAYAQLSRVAKGSPDGALPLIEQYP